MDLSCIIESGDLELYVLGLLPPDEAQKIEQLALLFPEVATEIDRISEALQVSAASLAATPSPNVKDALMQQVKALKQQEEAQTLSTQTSSEEELNKVFEKIPAKVVSVNKNRYMAAAVVALVASTAAIIYLTVQYNKKETDIAQLQQQVATLNNNLQQQQQQNIASTQMLQMMQSNDYKKINLTSVPGKPAALAQVFWNTKTTDVYIADVSLPAAPEGKQYQLWAIVDGKPVDAGMLQNAKQQAQKMKAFARADAFAITLENKGGSPTPTMEAMYVMAKTS